MAVKSLQAWCSGAVNELDPPYPQWTGLDQLGAIDSSPAAVALEKLPGGDDSVAALLAHFDLSALPVNAIVSWILIEIWPYCNEACDAWTLSPPLGVRVQIDGSYPSPLYIGAPSELVTTSAPVMRQLGYIGYLWGWDSISAADLIAGKLRVSVPVARDTVGTADAYIDAIRITVYYAQPTTGPRWYHRRRQQ